LGGPAREPAQLFALHVPAAPGDNRVLLFNRHKAAGTRELWRSTLS
jgi:hypothetical protein